MNKLFFSLVATAFIGTSVFGQCANWSNSPKKDDLENFHVIYRQAMKNQQWDLAFENWQRVFSETPAADGQRDIQYMDGIELYKLKFTNAKSDAEKEAAKSKIVELYNQAAECYKSKSIPCTGENCINQKLGYLHGRLAYDMYYFLNSDYNSNLAEIRKAIEFAGNNNEYIIFAPAANIAVYQFENGEMSKEEIVKLHKTLNDIADYQINSSTDLSAYFTQAKENMNGTFAKVEEQIFDCEYFAEKYQPDYESDPENMDLVKQLIAYLKSKGCTVEGNELLAQMSEQYDKFKDEQRTKMIEEFNANNPASVAKKLYDEGKFGAAIEKYDEAINQETEDKVRKSSLLFTKASIQFRKLGQFAAARSTALESARVNPNNGRPYMLIGDMYAKAAAGCGDSWGQGLAVAAAIEKYAQARSVDPSVSGEASSRINSYSRSLPDREVGFMRGVKDGASATCPCWIGETVRVKYKN
jgi:F0F1-type ATP synthase membrane subunit c/vacuolar-type H+-ATPase subunit K